MVKKSVSYCLFAVALTASTTLAAASVPVTQPWASLTTSQWREDLKYFADNAPLKHRNFYHAMTQAEFQDEIHRFDTAMPTLSPEQIVVEFIRLGAMIQDAHSSVSLAVLKLPYMPVRFVEFDDGVYVESADKAHAEMVGAKLVSVGSIGWKEAMAKIDPLVSDDAGNDGEKRTYAAHDYLNVPFILKGIGLSDSSQHATFMLEKAGKRRSYTLDASVPSAGFSVADLVFDPIPEGWVSARASGPSIPLARTHPDQAYWFEPVQQHEAVYVSLRAMVNMPGPTLADFAKQLGDYLGSHDVKRLIVDLRGNPGGDNTLLRPLLVTLIRANTNYRGGLWVLISHKTHSAAQNFVNRLESYTDAIFVGEPTSENVNFYGDPTGIELPNSHIPVYLSALWWQDKDPRDHRTATAPEIAVPQSFEQLVAGKDPALEIALTEPAPRPLEDLVKDAAPNGAAALMGVYKQYVSDSRHAYIADTEVRLNRAGYALLADNKPAQAVLVFQLCADTHPQSDNAFESLGEGLEAAGDKNGAIGAYTRSLQLNPGNHDAAGALKRLAAAASPK
ncbi:MAG TPA: hypothetical protein VGO35_00280 [Gammaproteobacteria bacterium]|jgi:tetratricopeptide (TPR) repeat protein|nr:hypothetical protein [Gammaproteobacteria bacterium]